MRALRIIFYGLPLVMVLLAGLFVGLMVALFEGCLDSFEWLDDEFKATAEVLQDRCRK